MRLISANEIVFTGMKKEIMSYFCDKKLKSQFLLSVWVQSAMVTSPRTPEVAFCMQCQLLFLSVQLCANAPLVRLYGERGHGLPPLCQINQDLLAFPPFFSL